MQIKTEAEAEKAARRHLKIEGDVATREADLKEKVTALKAKYGTQIKKLAEEDKEIMEALAEFYWANPDKRESKTKLINLSTVQLSEREVTYYTWPRGKEKVAAFIAKMKKLGFIQFIKTDESIKKQQIKDEASKDQLKAMGVKTDQDVTVYVEAL